MKVKFFVIFLVVVGIVGGLLEYEKTLKIEQYIKNKTKEHQAMYDAIYHSFHKRANVASRFLLNNEKILSVYRNLHSDHSIKQRDIQREKLQSIINTHCRFLQSEGIELLHFHLKDNESFFRMHKPEIYGDNLRGLRESVVYVNKHQKPVDGFEVGKHSSGYRFVYPIIDPDTKAHLGSMEIAFDLSLYIKEFMNTLDVLSNFRIHKATVDKKFYFEEDIHTYYKDSRIKDYYTPKKVLALSSKKRQAKIEKLKVDPKTIKKGVSSIEQKKAISVFDDASHDQITFIPVLNSLSQKLCGFITIRSDDKYIYNKRLNTYFIFTIFALATFVGLVFIYREIKAQKNLNKILQEKVDSKTQELQEINANLESRVKEEVDKNIKQEMDLFKQSKLAAIGDMIGNIAHQWRQPLAVMSSTASGIQLRHQCGVLDLDDLEADMESIVIKTKYLSETIETFRNYLKEKKQRVEIVLQDRVKLAITLTQSAFKDHGIKLIKELKEDTPIKMTLVAGELTEVLINIINNAKDILLEKKIKNPWVKVSIETCENDTVLVCIEDNGGGIPHEYLEKIFEQYFTTKDDSKGTGLGLHMSKKIVHESLEGELYAKNSEHGAQFYIQLPLGTKT